MFFILWVNLNTNSSEMVRRLGTINTSLSSTFTEDVAVVPVASDQRHSLLFDSRLLLPTGTSAGNVMRCHSVKANIDMGSVIMDGFVSISLVLVSSCTGHISDSQRARQEV